MHPGGAASATPTAQARVRGVREDLYSNIILSADEILPTHLDPFSPAPSSHDSFHCAALVPHLPSGPASASTLTDEESWCRTGMTPDLLLEAAEPAGFCRASPKTSEN